MIDSATRDALVAAACTSRKHAYAPYSNFAVGAALLGSDGQIYTGVNVENASFGLTICAERAAVFAMVTAGVQRIKAVAVCTSNGVSPCGACRQVLSEFAGEDGEAPVYIANAANEVHETTLHALLPLSFGREHL